MLNGAERNIEACPADVVIRERRFTGTMLLDNDGARSLARELGPLQLGAVNHNVVELLISVG